MGEDLLQAVPQAPTRHLLPCPYCGGTALRRVLIEGEAGRGVALECAAPHCQATINGAETHIGKIMALGVKQ